MTEIIKDGSVEAELLALTNCDREALALNHSGFTMFLENGELMFRVTGDVARTLYHKGLTPEKTDAVISAIDIALSSKYPNSFKWVQDNAMDLDPAKYTELSNGDQIYLLCYICNSFLQLKFEKFSTLEDVTRPIPIQIFLSVLSKYKTLEVVHRDKEGYEYAGILQNITIIRGMFSMRISASLSIISYGADGYALNYMNVSLPFIESAMTLADLGLQPVTSEDKARLTLRGEKYAKYAEKPTYCSYNDFAFRPGSWFGDTRTKINGRVMVDINAMRALNPSIDDDWYAGNPFNDDGNGTPVLVVHENLWMTSPVVFGFSFTTKAWVRMRIESIADIEFSEGAFEELIIPDVYKEVFVACLTNDMPSLDAVEGKGNGKIFLLHGPAGTGKTLSAESVAEYLKMPIYYVSVGELGVSPETMESSLSSVMDVATSWNAIVLLDEVDVFAVKRSGADIQRNAMTAILLRLLERFDGILFMTTNLIYNLDDAFKSRATAVISYPALGSADRITIWKSLLSKVASMGVAVAPEVSDSIDEIAEYAMNGREIKNCVRLAYSMAMSKPDKILTAHILDSVLALKFI